MESYEQEVVERIFLEEVERRFLEEVERNQFRRRCLYKYIQAMEEDEKRREQESPNKGKGSNINAKSTLIPAEDAILLDSHGLKHMIHETDDIKSLLDQAASKVVLRRGYPESMTFSNIQMVMGIITIAIALASHFLSPTKFPENRGFLIGCISLYVIFRVLLLFITYMENQNILLTNPPPGSCSSTGLRISSNLPRHSDMYTLSVASSHPKSKLANPPVKLTKSVRKWFTKDGFLIVGLFWKDVEKLINDYNRVSRG